MTALTAAASERFATSVERRPAVRLTRRGRVLILLVLCVLVLAAFSVGRITSSASGAGAPATRAVVVHPGDTLWAIAHRALPAEDPRAAVDRIERLNGLSSADIRVGQRLVVPAP